MELSVSLEEKKDFLQWFIEYQLLETYEINWFIEQLIENDTLLSQVHFVEEINNHHKSIWMGKEDSHGFSFLFRKGKVSSKDIYTAYHDLMLHPEEPLFFLLKFQEPVNTQKYQTVIEPGYYSKRQLQIKTEVFLNEILVNNTCELLRELIDEALITGNVADFEKYALQLKELSEA
ncbi:MAG TPA: YpiB family protein [Pseudogracilibacillus sp.]|nr:YpiB family protein [Pseudogracilibacillus sp.]